MQVSGTLLSLLSPFANRALVTWHTFISSAYCIVVAFSTVLIYSAAKLPVCSQ